MEYEITTNVPSLFSFNEFKGNFSIEQTKFKQFFSPHIGLIVFRGNYLNEKIFSQYFYLKDHFSRSSITAITEENIFKDNTFRNISIYICQINQLKIAEIVEEAFTFSLLGLNQLPIAAI